MLLSFLNFVPDLLVIKKMDFNRIFQVSSGVVFCEMLELLLAGLWYLYSSGGL